MGVLFLFKLFSRVFPCFFLFYMIVVVAHTGSICDVQGCNCSITALPWIRVLCNFTSEQDVALETTHVPSETMEIFMNGGEEVNFGPKFFDNLPALTLLRTEKTRNVIMEEKSFFQIKSRSLLIQIENSDSVVIKTGAFDSVQSSLIMEITNVASVIVEKAAFCKLHRNTYKNVGTLHLHTGSFELKKQASIMGKHGPVSVVSFENIAIPKIPEDVFLTALASVTFKNCQIGSISKNAFKAPQISAVSFVDSNVECFEEGAITERTLILNFSITRCTIARLRSKAITAAFADFSLAESRIESLESESVVVVVARVNITGNRISNLDKSALVFNNWNVIHFDNNFIDNLCGNFVVSVYNSEAERFSFTANEIDKIERGALGFLTKFPSGVLLFEENIFHTMCNCYFIDWFKGIFEPNEKDSEIVIGSSLCSIDTYTSACYSLTKGKMYFRSFQTEICARNLECKPELVKSAENGNFFSGDLNETQGWLVISLTVGGLLLLAVLLIFTVLVVRNSRKRIFDNGERIMEEENTIVTVDESKKLEMPEELTIEFLQVLSKHLDDPLTHQDASEMIERLYDMFVVDESYENNNRQEEEAHLYEELENLKLQIPPPPYEPRKTSNESRLQTEPRRLPNEPRNILRLVEERLPNLQSNKNEVASESALIGDYFEPSDAAIHIYSELQGRNRKDNFDNEDPSNSDQTTNVNYLFKAGPSSIYK